MGGTQAKPHDEAKQAGAGASGGDSPAKETAAEEKAPEEAGLHVTVNHEPVYLSGKSSYIFVDIFNVIDFEVHAGWRQTDRNDDQWRAGADIQTNFTRGMIS